MMERIHCGLNFLLSMEENYWSSSLWNLVRCKNFLLLLVGSNFSPVFENEQQSSLFSVVLILSHGERHVLHHHLYLCLVPSLLVFSLLPWEPGCASPVCSWEDCSVCLTLWFLSLLHSWPQWLWGTDCAAQELLRVPVQQGWHSLPELCLSYLLFFKRPWNFYILGLVIEVF